MTPDDLAVIRAGFDALGKEPALPTRPGSQTELLGHWPDNRSAARALTGLSGPGRAGTDQSRRWKATMRSLQRARKGSSLGPGTRELLWLKSPRRQAILTARRLVQGRVRKARAAGLQASLDMWHLDPSDRSVRHRTLPGGTRGGLHLAPAAARELLTLHGTGSSSRLGGRFLVLFTNAYGWDFTQEHKAGEWGLTKLTVWPTGTARP